MIITNEDESIPIIVNLEKDQNKPTENDDKEQEKLTDFKPDDKNISNYSSIVNCIMQQPQPHLQPKSMSTRQRRSYHVELAIQKN